MRIGVVIDPGSWYLRDLQRAAGNDYQLVPFGFSDLWGNAATADPAGSGLGDPRKTTAPHAPWQDCQALLVRTMPPGSLEQVVFRMNLLAQWEEEGCVVINPPRAMEIAVDKYLCSQRLARAGLPIPTTIACQTWQQSMSVYEMLGRDVVVKPLFGGEGRGIMRVEDPGLALRTFQTLHRLQAVIYLQPYIPHQGFDYRVFVLGERHYVIRRRNPHDWRTNLSRGAQAEPVTESGPWVELGIAAAAATGTPIAGVDILPGQDGRLTVLEVNAVPGWKGLQAALDRDIAREVLDFLARRKTA